MNLGEEASEVRPGLAPTSLWPLLRKNLAASALVFALLECWRSHFFLTDDNLTGGLPFFIEMGHHLLAGKSPFMSEYLFGGHYNLLRDPTFFAWHPLYLLTSLLADTPFRFCIIDLDAFLLYQLATAGFVVLASYLRREMKLTTLTDGWIMFVTLSFTYSAIALIAGASWLNFLGNHSALPWLALGILRRSWRNGAGLVALFTLHMLLGGHLAPTVSTSVFLTAFAVAISVARRSWRPLARWALGYSVAVIATLPLLLPVLGGFLGSGRAQGVGLKEMELYNLPFLQFLPSLMIGSSTWLSAHDPPPVYWAYLGSTGACAAAWCVLPLLLIRTPWRKLEIVSGVMVLFIALMIIRPLWITEVMRHIPVLRSMRWPFREFLEFQFFFHLFLLIRPQTVPNGIRVGAAVVSAAIFLVPMLLNPLPPTFNATKWDRELILGRGFESYWKNVRPLLDPDDRVAVILPKEVHDQEPFDEPFCLLPTYNYACLARVTNANGYSPTAPANQLYTKTPAYFQFGAYLPEEKPALLAERPHLKFITLESLKPLRITLSSADGPTVDLTPFVPLAARGTLRIRRCGSPTLSVGSGEGSRFGTHLRLHRPVANRRHSRRTPPAQRRQRLLQRGGQRPRVLRAGQKSLPGNRPLSLRAHLHR